MEKKGVLNSLQRLEKIFADDKEAIRCLLYLRERASLLEESNRSEISSSPSFPLPEEIHNDGLHFALFSDGACRGNPGPGAWAAMGQASDGKVLFELSGLNTQTTNNRMELEGAICALKELAQFLLDHQFQITASSPKVFLYSDSKYVVEGAKNWMIGWKNRGWKKADNKIPENLEYWKELDQVLENFPSVSFIWVKGHAGHPQNEKCDQLANLALNEAGF